MKALPVEQRKAIQELARRELARRNFLDFVTYNSHWFKVSWHHRIIAEALERVERGELKRLMVFLPPRHSKSEMISINYPAWVLGRDKNKSIMQASYSAELAAEFGRQARNMVMSPEYKNIFDTVLSEDSKSKSTWSTQGRGRYNALGVGGSATGKGADILIIDDPIKNRKDADSFLVRENIYKWYQSTARTRLSPKGAVIIVVTRWHDDDLAGRLLMEGGEGSVKWEVINFPAISTDDERYRKAGEALWPEQFNLENLLQTKSEIGTYEWSSLYQQNPLNTESQEFKKNFFKNFKESDLTSKLTTCFITIDSAVKEDETSDFTGVVINRVDPENNWHLKAHRKKFNSARLIDHIFDLWLNERPDVIGIEETTFIEAIYPFLKMEMVKRNIFPVIYPLKHHGKSKVLRIRGLLPKYEAGKIFHLEGQCDLLEEEQLRFPKGLHDDVLDALAYQDQIVVPPITPLTRYQEVREEMMMELDPQTGYFR